MDCLQYLALFMPADSIFLEYSELELGSIRTIAKATLTEGTRLDLLTPMPPEAIAAIEQIQTELDATRWQEGNIFNRLEEHPVGRPMGERFDVLDSSIMTMMLEMPERRMGGVVITAKGKDRYKEEHRKLLTVLKRPFSVAMTNALRYREVTRLKDLLKDDNRYLHQELLRLSGEEIIGSDFGLKNVLEAVRQVAPLDSPVLLLGETGVGKDVIANAIHYSSPRHKSPFIAVNSGAIPQSLLDSELFGHEKGTFTGALSQKRGRFERADKGTIFLDEIGELPPQAQIRLLRVLQNKEIERLGGSKAIPVDVRIIAATHRNLEEMIKANLFREDLWFRINVFPIIIPPLRARKEDIPALTHHFIERKSKQLRLPEIPALARGVIDQLMAYHWPGNVRELENVIERALILNKGEPLKMAHGFGPSHEKISPTTSFDEISEMNSGPLKLNEITEKHIRKIIELTKGRVHGPGGAAELLGINPSTLRNKMNKLGILYGRNMS